MPYVDIVSMHKSLMFYQMSEQEIEEYVRELYSKGNLTNTRYLAHSSSSEEETIEFNSDVSDSESSDSLSALFENITTNDLKVFNNYPKQHFFKPPAHIKHINTIQVIIRKKDILTSFIALSSKKKTKQRECQPLNRDVVWRQQRAKIGR